jgi:hypothetical protein
MKKFLNFLFACMLLAVTAQAQVDFLIKKIPAGNGFKPDSATSVRFRCIQVQIDQNTTNQRPAFYLELLACDSMKVNVDSTNITLHNGRVVDGLNVYYDDLVNACIKNNIPKEQHSATIQGLYYAVFCGTRAQKRNAIAAMLKGYNILLQ